MPTKTILNSISPLSGGPSPGIQMIINVGQDVGRGEESLFTVVGTTVATMKINGRSLKKTVNETSV